MTKCNVYIRSPMLQLCFDLTEQHVICSLTNSGGKPRWIILHPYYFLLYLLSSSMPNNFPTNSLARYKGFWIFDKLCSVKKIQLKSYWFLVNYVWLLRFFWYKQFNQSLSMLQFLYFFCMCLNGHILQSYWYWGPIVTLILPVRFSTSEEHHVHVSIFPLLVMFVNDVYSIS